MKPNVAKTNENVCNMFCKVQQTMFHSVEVQLLEDKLKYCMCFAALNVSISQQ